MAVCRLCSAEIKWVRTRNGGNMPCDPEKVHYIIDNMSAERIVTPHGDVLRCRIMNPHTDNISQADGWGYVPHFTTCKGGIVE